MGRLKRETNRKGKRRFLLNLATLMPVMQLGPNLQERAVSPTQRYDPIGAFPVELIEQIFSHLCFRDLVKCLSISKTWHWVLTNNQILWSSVIDLTQVPCTSVRMFERYLSYALGASRSDELYIDQLGGNIRLHGSQKCEYSKSELYHFRVNVRSPSYSLFEGFDLYKTILPNLRILTLQVSGVEYFDLHSLILNAPALKSLSLHVVRLIGKPPQDIPVLNLQKLSLVRIKSETEEDDGFIAELINRSPDLVDLELSIVHRVSDRLIQAVRECSGLQYLTLRYEFITTPTQIPELTCRGLKKLDLQCWELARIMTVDGKKTCNPVVLSSLQTLNIMCETYLEGEGIWTIIDFYGATQSIRSLKFFSNRNFHIEEVRDICKHTPRIRRLTVPCGLIHVSEVEELADSCAGDLEEVNVRPRMVTDDDIAQLIRYGCMETIPSASKRWTEEKSVAKYVGSVFRRASV
jgi:hypothetical protein